MKEELYKIDKVILKCEKCKDKVEKFNHYTTIYYGKDNDILIVGEAPANNGWRKSGKCWYKEDGKITASGEVMTKLLKVINYNLEDVSFIEAVKCFPILRNNLNYCKEKCYPYLLKQISILKPKLILTLGDVATKSLLKDLNYKRFSDVIGNKYILKIEDNNYDVIPIYHPSPISPLGYKGNIEIFSKIKESL